MIHDVAEVPSSRRYRILALDGGGVKGTFTASVLASLESLTGKRITDHFDLITGTSTGGIIAIGIGQGVSPQRILDMYVNQGPSIFPCTGVGFRGWMSAIARHFWRPKHCQSVLRAALGEALGDRYFGESKNRLVIPAFNAVNGDIQLFKTAHSSAYRMDHQLPAIEVAMATSAAPTYFAAFTDTDGRSYIDGGVWANCPVMVGVVEAVASLEWPLDRVDILSIGTTDAPMDVSHRRRRGGLAQWNIGLLDLLMAAQVKGTLGLANAITKKGVTRIDVITRPGRFTLDDSTSVHDLKSLGENAARKSVDMIIERFFQQPVDPFRPCLVTTSSLLRPGNPDIPSGQASSRSVATS